MTVPTYRSREDYTGNGATTSYPYQFRIYEATDLVVTRATPDSVETTLVLNTDYTVTGVGKYAGGNVVLASVLASGHRLAIERALPVTQETDLRNQGAYFAETHEDVFDRAIMILQRIAGYLGLGPDGAIRTLLLGKTDIDGSGAYDARSNRIKNLDDPADNQDAATKQWSLNTIAASMTDGAGNAVLQLLASSDPQNGAALVAYDENKQYPDGTVGANVYGKNNPRRMNVAIVYGQSNAVGYANNSPGRPAINSRAKRWTGSAISPLTWDMTHSSGDSSTGHAWVAFSNQFIDMTRESILIVPCARGGSSIDELSKPGAWYSAMLAYAQNAIAAVNASADYELGDVFVLYHQGETDQANAVTRETYLPKFETLAADMLADIPASRFFNFTVGCPVSRPELTWYGIQDAQRYACNRQAALQTAFDYCGAFTRNNGLTRTDDGTHYTQGGYNLMGLEGATTVVKTLRESSGASKQDIYSYGFAQISRDQQWQGFAASVQVLSGVWTLLSQDSGTFKVKASNVSTMSLLSDRIRIYLTCQPDDILQYAVCGNREIGRNKLQLDVEVGGFDAGLGRYYVDVFLWQTLEFQVNASTGAITTANGTTSTYLNSIVTASVDGVTKVVTVTHPASDSMPLLEPVATTNLGAPDQISKFKINATSFKFLLKQVPTNQVVSAVLSSIKVDPTKLASTEFNSLMININGIVSGSGT